MDIAPLRDRLNTMVRLAFTDGEEVEALLLGVDLIEHEDLTYEVRRIVRGFDWPVGQVLALRADAAYSHFGKSLFSEATNDCAASPCTQPPSRFATFSAALDAVIRPSTNRLHYIVGVSRDHVVESVMTGPRAANALDIGAGLRLGPHAAIEMEVQWLEKAVGPTRWVAPIRVRWR